MLRMYLTLVFLTPCVWTYTRRPLGALNSCRRLKRVPSLWTGSQWTPRTMSPTCSGSRSSASLPVVTSHSATLPTACCQLRASHVFPSGKRSSAPASGAHGSSSAATVVHSPPGAVLPWSFA